MSQPELEEMLKKINEAMAEANGDVKKEAVLLSAITDPMDSLQCDSCQ